jgi:chorismate mutase / prephenate dehydratase
MTQPVTLADLRREIDRIDLALLALLRERADIVSQVPGIKGKLPLYIRAGREATMMRDLMSRPQGKLPVGLVPRLWREIISAFTLQEGAFSVAVVDRFWDLARDFYGGLTPLSSVPMPKDALGAVANGQHKIAILPVPSSVEDWWVHHTGPARIFARLPFAGWGAAGPGNRRHGTEAIALADLDCEDTGNDRSYLRVRAASAHLVSESWTVLHRHQSGDDMLLEVVGYTPPTDPRLIPAIHLVGGYAVTPWMEETGEANCPPRT